MNIAIRRGAWLALPLCFGSLALIWSRSGSAQAPAGPGGPGTIPAAAGQGDSAPRLPGRSTTRQIERKIYTGVGAPWAYGAGQVMDEKAQADQEQEARTLKLLADYNASNDEANRRTIMDELSKTVAAHFDIRQQIREQELKALEEQVRKLRAVQEQRTRQKDQIIQDRVRQLLRDAEGLGWGVGEGSLRASQFPSPVPGPTSR